MLDISVDFLNNQALLLTDVNGTSPPAAEQAAIRLLGTDLPTGVIGSVDLLLVGVFGSPSLRPNPDAKDCTTTSSAACTTGGFGDLVSGAGSFIGFEGFHATYTNNTLGTITLGSFTFRFDGESVQSTTVVPAPAPIALLGIGLAGIGLSRRRRVYTA